MGVASRQGRDGSDEVVFLVTLNDDIELPNQPMTSDAMATPNGV